MSTSRRNFIKRSAILGALSGSVIPAAETERLLKVVCTGAHPDDPESGCGGTLAKFSAAGNVVTILYLTRGEAGINGKSQSEAAAIRTREAERACAILKTKPVFAGQIDGSTVVDEQWISRFSAMIAAEKPDIVFTHWPIDSHKDHQAASVLTIQSWIRSKSKFDLYFYEVCTGEQTMNFRPTDFVDITDTTELKRRALFCHESQDPQSVYTCGHAAMEKFRGMEAGYTSAEAFVKMTGMSAPGKIL